MQNTVRGTKVPLQQPTPDRHQSCSDIDTASFMFSPNDSNSVLEEANLAAQTKTLNLIVKNWNVVLVGESNTGQLDCNCHLHNDQNPGYKRFLHEDLHCDGGPKVMEDQKTKDREHHQLQPDHDGQNGHRAMSDEIVVDVEPLMPLIKTRG